MYVCLSSLTPLGIILYVAFVQLLAIDFVRDIRKVRTLSVCRCVILVVYVCAQLLTHTLRRAAFGVAVICVYRCPRMSCGASCEGV